MSDSCESVKSANSVLQIRVQAVTSVLTSHCDVKNECATHDNVYTVMLLQFQPQPKATVSARNLLMSCQSENAAVSLRRSRSKSFVIKRDHKLFALL